MIYFFIPVVIPLHLQIEDVKEMFEDVVLTFTTGAPHKYHRSATGHVCKVHNVCDIFFIAVVTSVVLTCTPWVPDTGTTEVPQEILKLTCTTGVPHSDTTERV